MSDDSLQGYDNYRIHRVADPTTRLISEDDNALGRLVRPARLFHHWRQVLDQRQAVVSIVIFQFI